MARFLVFRDETEEAHAAGRDALDELKPGFQDKVGLRNARRFLANEIEPADTVIVVGSWPEVIKAYEGVEGCDVHRVDEYESDPGEVVEFDEAATEEKAARKKAVKDVADEKLKAAEKHASDRKAAKAQAQAEVDDAIAAKRAAKAEESEKPKASKKSGGSA